MKELVSKLVANLHFVILAYGAFLVWEQWGEHSARVDEIEAQFPVVQESILKTQKEVEEITEFKKKREESEAQVKMVEENILQAQRQLPEAINDNEILAFFNSEMGSLNIKDPSIAPGKETPSTFFISKEYNIKARGTFLQFLVLFERIGNASRIFNVKNLKLFLGNENQKGRFQIISGDSVIEAFRYNPDFKVNRLETVEGAPTP